jgi:CRP/FNR family transcriptional regulator, cyclic AMP receptor protein
MTLEPECGAEKESPRADGHLDVFGAIPPEYRAAVLEQCNRRVVRKGQAVWTQGENAEYVAFLASGTAMSLYQAPNGRIGTTGFWCAGDILGAGDIGLRTTRQMTVRCLDTSVMYTLTYSRFQHLLQRFPELADTVIRALSLRLRWVAQLAVMLETQSGVERICAALLALADRFGRSEEQGTLIDLRLTNEDLAAISGLSRQFVNATLSTLRKDGYLRMRKRSIIVDSKALANAMGLDEMLG